MPGEEELQPIGEGPETKPLLPGFKAGFNLSSTWSSFSSLTTSITHSIGQGIGTDNQKLLAITLNSWVSRKPDVDPVLSLQFPLFQSDVEKVICAAGHDYALIAEVLKPHAKSDAWSLQGTPDYEPPGLSGDQSACWLIGLYNAIEALPDKKADHTHLKTHVFKPYCEAHLRARVEQLLVYPLPSVELEFAVIELGGLAKILDDGDLKCRVQYIVQAFEHAIGYFNGQHVGIAPVVYEEAHKEDPAFSLNKKLEHIQKKYNTEVINLLNQMIRTSAIDKKMQRVDELCNPGFAVDKKTQSLVSANADYKLACSIDDELDGLFNKNAVFENINNIITQTTGLRVESCKLNMFARIEKFRDASCEQFLADLCAANTLDELQNFYKQYVESSQPLQHMDLDQLTCDNHKLVWYRFWNDIKSVLFFLSKPEQLEVSCDQLYQKLDAICCDMSIFASDFEKKERDFNRKVKEFLSRKIEELYITPLKVKLLEKLGQKKEDFEKKMLSLAQMQDALRTFEKSIEHKQCSRRLLQQNVECKKVYQALLNLVAKKETLYREVLLVRPPVSKDAIDIIGKTGDSHCIKVGEALLNVPAGINHELLVAGELFAQPAPEKKSHLYKSFYSERFSPLWLVELFEPIQSVPPAYQEQKTHFERIFNDYFTAYMNRLLKEAIIYPLHLPLLQVARDELCGIKDDIKARFSENCKRDINNVLHALNNAIDYINSDSIEMKKVPIEQYGRGFVLSIDPYLEDVTQKYLEESIRRLEVLDEPLPPPVPVERPVVQISKKRKKVLTRRAEISTSVGLGGNPSVRITSDVILADHPELDIMGKSAPSPVVHINDDIPSLEDSYLFLTNLDKGNNTESISNVIYYLNSISYHIPSLKERVDAIHAGYYKKLNACLKKLSFCKYEIQAAKNRLNNKREYVEKWSVYNNEDFSETKSKLNDDVQSSLTEIAELEKNHAEIEAEDKINLLSFFSEVAALLKEECIVNNVQVLEYVQSLRSPHELDVSHQEVSEPDPSLDTNNKIIRAPRASYKKSGVIKIQTPPEIDFHEKKIREHIEKNRDYLVFCKVYEYLSNRKGYHKNIHAMIAEAKKIRNEKFREKIFKKIEDIRNQSKQLFIEALAAIGNFTELSAFQEKIATDWAPYLGLNEQQCGRDLVYYSFWSKINEVVRLLRDPNQLLDADDDARNYNAMCAVLNEIKFPNSLLSNPDNDSFAEAFHREINKLLYEKMQCLYAQRFETLCFQKLDAAFTAVKKQMSLGEREAVFDESKRAIENDPRFEACLDLLTYQQKIANFQRYLVEPTEEEKEEATRRDNVAIVAADHYILPASSAPFPLPGDRLQALREVRKNKTEEQALVVQREAESAAAVATELEKQRVCIETVKAIVQEIQSDTTCVRTISFFGWYISLGGKVKTVQELEHVIAKANGSELNAFSWLWFCQCIPFAEKVKTVEDTRNGKMPTVQQLLEPLRARHSRKYDWPHIGFRTDATKSKLADWESRLKELEEDTSYSKSLGV